MFKYNWIAASMSFSLTMTIMHACPLESSAQSLGNELEESKSQPLATPDELRASWINRTERLGDAEVFVQAPNKFLWRSGSSKNQTNKFLTVKGSTLHSLRHSGSD